MTASMLESYEHLDVLRHGDRYPVTIGPIMRSEKWKGGTFVRYIEDESDTDIFTVERSNGAECCGFVIYGSEDYTNARQSTYRNFTSYQNTSPLANALGTAVITLVAGGGRFLFKNFETIALQPNGVRNGNPIVYKLNENLKISENGLLCNDPDANLLAATGANEVVIAGICCKVPTVKNPKLGLDYKF